MGRDVCCVAAQPQVGIALQSDNSRIGRPEGVYAQTAHAEASLSDRQRHYTRQRQELHVSVRRDMRGERHTIYLV